VADLGALHVRRSSTRGPAGCFRPRVKGTQLLRPARGRVETEQKNREVLHACYRYRAGNGDVAVSVKVPWPGNAMADRWIAVVSSWGRSRIRIAAAHGKQQEAVRTAGRARHACFICGNACVSDNNGRCEHSPISWRMERASHGGRKGDFPMFCFVRNWKTG
jgi:hypothetical protein